MLEAHDLSLDCVVPAQLAGVRDLAQAHLGLTIVINHFATLEPGQPQAVLRAIFSDTARRIYRL